MSACSTPRSSIAAASSTCCSASPISCSARTRSRSPDAVNTGLNSGLDTKRSDYVARVAYQPDNIYTFTSRFRFDENTFEVRRFEVEGRANFDRWSAHRALRQLRRAARDRLPRAPPGHTRPGHVQVHAELERARLGALRHRGQADQPAPRSGSATSTTALHFALNYMTDYTYSGNDDDRSQGAAGDQSAHDRRHAASARASTRTPARHVAAADCSDEFRRRGRGEESDVVLERERTR